VHAFLFSGFSVGFSLLVSAMQPYVTNGLENKERELNFHASLSILQFFTIDLSIGTSSSYSDTAQYTDTSRHGLPLPQPPFYDGAAAISQFPIPPGKTLLYSFTSGGGRVRRGGSVFSTLFAVLG
jgi:hypothetical protein